jgi:hypothetical protein
MYVCLPLRFPLCGGVARVSCWFTLTVAIIYAFICAKLVIMGCFLPCCARLFSSYAAIYTPCLFLMMSRFLQWFTWMTREASPSVRRTRHNLRLLCAFRDAEYVDPDPGHGIDDTAQQVFGYAWGARQNELMNGACTQPSAVRVKRLVFPSLLYCSGRFRRY